MKEQVSIHLAPEELGASGGPRQSRFAVSVGRHGHGISVEHIERGRSGDGGFDRGPQAWARPRAERSPAVVLFVGACNEFVFVFGTGTQYASNNAGSRDIESLFFRPLRVSCRRRFPAATGD